MIGQKGYPPVHGGIERHVAELAARLPGLGVHVDIYSRPHYSDADGPTPLEGVRVRRRPSIPTKHFDAISHTMVCTLDAMRDAYDVIHYHALGPGLLAGVPRLFGRAGTVTTVHGLDWQREKWGPLASSVLRLGERASARLPDRTIVVSRALQEHYRVRYGRETVSIPNGINPPEVRSFDEIAGLGIRPGYVLFVGRLVPEKGCHLLTRAYEALPEDMRRNHQLVVAGDAGFTEGYVRDLKKAAGDDTVFTGYVHGPTLDELWSNAALVVLPSTLEGLSIALLEAMSYRNCCLVSDIPPNREAGGDTVAYVGAGEVEELTVGMKTLLEDPLRREDLAVRAAERAISEYSWETAAIATAAVYREIAGEK
jgi:glycosyltransferase involved in cell wall biosynthesis